MKEFATKATLISEDGGIKTYRIEYVDKHGRSQEEAAIGRDMSEALRTIIKKRQYKRLESVPLFAWVFLAITLISSFSIVAIRVGSPIMTILGGGFGLAAVYMLVDKYFKYAE